MCIRDRYRLEVPERGLADGEILEKVCLEKLQDQVEKLLALGRESICLFFVNFVQFIFKEIVINITFYWRCVDNSFEFVS